MIKRQNVCQFKSKKNYNHSALCDFLGFRICSHINAIAGFEPGTGMKIPYYEIQISAASISLEVFGLINNLINIFKGSPGCNRQHQTENFISLNLLQMSLRNSI